MGKTCEWVGKKHKWYMFLLILQLNIHNTHNYLFFLIELQPSKANEECNDGK